MAIATFAAGRFWPVEETFRKVYGVLGTRVGYMGGTVENPTVEAVAEGETGHVEVVEIEFDEIKVNYRRLLDVFWGCHDPTQIVRQGHPIGSQFRAVIFYHTPEQKAAAEHSRMMLVIQLSQRRPVLTSIAEASTFWPAPDDQQRYFLKHGAGGQFINTPAQRSGLG